jgi:hypothetical protein
MTPAKIATQIDRPERFHVEVSDPAEMHEFLERAADRSLRGLLPANLRPQPAHHAARLTWLVQLRGGAGLANRA